MVKIHRFVHAVYTLQEKFKARTLIIFMGSFGSNRIKEEAKQEGGLSLQVNFNQFPNASNGMNSCAMEKTKFN